MSAPHPDVRRLLDTVLRSAPNASEPTVEGIRSTSLATGELLGGPGESVARVWNGAVETSHGTRDLRWYLPFEEPARSLIFFVHGGGWVSGTLDSYDTFCRALALRTGRIVASLAYTLSPEVRHPQALEEVADALQCVRELAALEGLPIDILAVCGDSAGGHLIAAAMHCLAEKGLRLPDAAVLIYPITDASMRHESYTAFATGYSLTTAKMEWYWRQYLGQNLGQRNAKEADPLLTPLRSPYLSRFPRSLLITAEFDPLHDEGGEMAHRMKEAGVTVECVDVPGQIHGFMRFRKALTDPEWGPDAIMNRIGRFLDQS